MTETTQSNDILQYHGQCIAVLSDIHSNACALEACLEDAKRAGADCFVFLGDYISGLADSIKVMDLVYEIQDKYSTCAASLGMCFTEEGVLDAWRASKNY